MKAKTQFLKMYYKMPEASRNLVWFMGSDLHSLNVIAMEVKADTFLSKKILNDMGFEDK